MARFKRKAARRSSGRSFFSRSRRAVSKQGSTANLMTTALAAAAYGFGRPHLEKLIQPVTSKIPMGGYTDEVVLGAVGYFAAKGKFGNNKLIKSVGNAMLVIEAARVGSSIGQVTSSGSSANNALAYDY